MTAAVLAKPSPALGSGLSSSARRFPKDAALATGAALLVAVLVAWGLGRYPLLGGDEGIYTEQAWGVLQGDVTPYTYTYDHPFLGWLQLASLSWLVQALHLGGPLSVANVRVLMLLVSFISMLLTYGIARRLDFARPFAVASVLVVGLSPLYVTYSRQVLLDNVALVWLLAAFYLVLNRSKNQWAYGAAGAALGLAILSKETVLLFTPALAYLLWQQAWKPLRAMSAAFFLTLLTTTLLIYPLFALLRSEFFPGEGHVSLLGDGILYQLSGRVSSGALWEAYSGRNLLMTQWLAYDSWLLIVGVVSAMLLLINRRLRFLGVAVLLWGIPVLRPSGYLPGMYVIAVLPFAGLAAAGLFDAAFRAARKLGARAAVAATGVLALAAAVLVAGAGHSYIRNTRVLVTADPVAAQEQAFAWVVANVPRNQRIYTDDVFFVDLARAGWSAPWQGAVSYYKYNLDPRALVEVPTWRDVDYVLETPEMRRLSGSREYTRSAEVLQNSYVVASFGSGDAEVAVRRVGQQPPAPTAQQQPPAPAAPAAPPASTPSQLPTDSPEAKALLQQFANSLDVEERRRLIQEYRRMTGAGQ